MRVHVCSPFRTDKNLGKAYNEAMNLLQDDDWACLVDMDTCFLTPDAGPILQEYATQNPNAGILTCFTNRVSPFSKRQLLNGSFSECTDFTQHIKLAEDQKKFLYSTTPINRDISGMLMMIRKSFWIQYPFPEDAKCLGVDTYYGRRIRESGHSILRMNGLYIWHTYRLSTGIKDKSHLL